MKNIKKDFPKYLCDLTREEQNLIIQYRLSREPNPAAEEERKRITEDLIRNHKIPAEMLFADKSNKG